MTDPRIAPIRRFLPIFIGLIFLVLAYQAVRSALPKALTPLGQARSLPQDVAWHDGAWYWIERPDKKPARLIRADAGGQREVATAEEIGEICLSGDRLAWTSRTGNKWSITMADARGSSRTYLLGRLTRPRGLWIEGGGAHPRIYWLEATPPAVPGCEPFPPLGPSCNVLSIAEPEEQPTVLTTLMEPDGQQILGKRGDDLFFSTFREGSLGTTAMYRVNQKPDNGSEPGHQQGDVPTGNSERGTRNSHRAIPQRIAAASGRQKALLTSSGDIFWLAMSREASSSGSIYCVRRLEKDGEIDTVCDWLPHGGQLTEIGGQMVYLDGSFLPRAWPIPGRRDLPRPIDGPDGYATIGIGDSDLLLTPIGQPSGNQGVPLYRMAWR